jgi:L-lactate dehydrogenase (cytochrome)
MNLSAIRELVHIGRPDAPYGARALARCLSIADLRRLARRRLPAGALGYLEGGGEDEWTLRRNREAFGEIELVPRALRGVSRPDTGTTVLGTRMPLPFALSPIGAPAMFHHDGELAVARAARQAGLPYGVSTLATQSLEAIADAAQGTPLWFQLLPLGRPVRGEEAGRAGPGGGIPGPCC